MTEDYEGHLDSAADVEGSGLDAGGLDAAQAEGPTGGPEPQTADLDLNQPLFAYGEGENERQLTGHQILESLEAAERLPGLTEEITTLKAQLEALQRSPQPGHQPGMPSGQPAPAGPPAQPQIDVAGIGPKLEAMLSGEQGGLENIGTDLVNLIQAVVQSQVMPQISQERATEQAMTRFSGEFPDYTAALQDGRIQQFMAQNPEYSEVNAFLVLTNRTLNERLGQLEGQIKAAQEAGFKLGEQQTIKDMKARGLTLRGIGPGGKASTPGKKGQFDLTTSAGRRAAMLADPRLMET